MTDEQQESKTSIPPTPPAVVDAESVRNQAKNDVNNGGSIGCLMIIGCSVLSAVLRGIYGLFLFIVMYGIAIWVSYYVKRPYFARGLLIILGIVIGVPLLLWGLWMTLSAGSR
ncbi:MAG TPA: hypothetical protein PLZ36_05790 [Armatimonadota bacterium]|nr:hypothetical protein [Armatimonadota bacterium]HOS42707.1 hypothetical protein [Armatimonadota bacterium]